jgi:periplasmic divalent cation tolerance protein
VKLSRSFVTVWVTMPRRHLAVKLSRLTVESGLAACAQISGPIESIYRWQGIVESAKEWRVVLKTRSRLLPKLEALVIAHHPYDTPQFVVLPIVGGSEKYLDWLAESTTTTPPRSARKRSKNP